MAVFRQLQTIALFILSLIFQTAMIITIIAIFFIGLDSIINYSAESIQN